MGWVEKDYKRAQIWFLIFLWVLMTGMAQVSLGIPLYDFPIWVFSLSIMGLVMLNFWALDTVLRVPKVWERVFLLLIASTILYFINYFLTVYPLKYFMQIYAGIPRLVRWYGLAYVDAFDKVFTLIGFAWVSTYIYLPLVIYTCGYVMMKHMAAVKNNADLMVLNAGLELENLKAQFHPHFLFNTLNNIYGLVMENEKAGEAVLKMSDLLRFSLYESQESSIPLSREIQFLEDYIHLEKIRHHDHVAIDFDVKVTNMETPIAPLLLISFVENAFKHGVNKSIAASWVKINLTQEGNSLSFVVCNSIPQNKQPLEVGGIGLENAQRRLELLYPEKHTFKVSVEENTFKIALTIIDHGN